MGATNDVLCARCGTRVGDECPHFVSAEWALLAAADEILRLPVPERLNRKWRLGPRFGRAEHPALQPLLLEGGRPDVSYKVPLGRSRIHITGTEGEAGYTYEIHQDAFDPDRIRPGAWAGHLLDVAGGNISAFRQAVREAGGLPSTCPPLVVDPYKRIDWIPEARADGAEGGDAGDAAA